MTSANSTFVGTNQMNGYYFDFSDQNIAVFKNTINNKISSKLENILYNNALKGYLGYGSIAPNINFYKSTRPIVSTDVFTEHKSCLNDTIIVRSLRGGLENMISSSTGSSIPSAIQYNNVNNTINGLKSLLKTGSLNNTCYSERDPDYFKSLDLARDYIQCIHDTIFVICIDSFITSFALRSSSESNEYYNDISDENRSDKIYKTIISDDITKNGHVGIKTYLIENRQFNNLALGLSNKFISNYPNLRSGIEGLILSTSSFINGIDSTSYQTKLSASLSTSNHLNNLIQLIRDHTFGKMIERKTDDTYSEGFKIDNHNDVFRVMNAYIDGDEFRTVILSLKEQFKMDTPNGINVANTHKIKRLYDEYNIFYFYLTMFLFGFLMAIFVVLNAMRNNKLSNAWVSAFIVYFILTFMALSLYYTNVYLEKRTYLKLDTEKIKDNDNLSSLLLFFFSIIILMFLLKTSLTYLSNYIKTKNISDIVIFTLFIILSVLYSNITLQLLKTFNFISRGTYLLDPQTSNEFMKKNAQEQTFDIVSVILYLLALLGVYGYLIYKFFDFYSFYNMNV